MAPVGLGGLFSCLILLYTMLAQNSGAIFQSVQSCHNLQHMEEKISRNSTNSAFSLASGTCSPEDRAYQAQLVQDTKLWRNASELDYIYAGYKGPWVEQQFFEFWQKTSNGCPINGRFYLPIHYTLARRAIPIQKMALIGKYLTALDTSRKYFTILQIANGLHHRKLSSKPDADLDLMIFAAGGITTAAKTTNVPLPLLIKEQHVSIPRLPKNGAYVYFNGRLETHPIRERLAELYENEWNLKQDYNENWVTKMETSVFCLAPRG